MGPREVLGQRQQFSTARQERLWVVAASLATHLVGVPTDLSAAPPHALTWHGSHTILLRPRWRIRPAARGHRKHSKPADRGLH